MTAMDDRALIVGLTVLAVVSMAYPTWLLIMANIRADLANEALRKLFGAGNLDRARKLTRAAPKSVYFRSLEHALAADIHDDDGPALVRETLQGRFDRKLDEVMVPLRRSKLASYAGVVLGGTGAVLAATAQPIIVPAALISAAAALLSLNNLRRVGAMERQARASFKDIVGDAVACIRPGDESASAPG